MSSGVQAYQLGPLLGRGGFAEVFSALHLETKQEVAVKVIKKNKLTDEEMRSRVHNEIHIHSKLKHRSIVNVFDHFSDQDNVYIVMELCSNGNLFKHIRKLGRLDEKTAAKYFFQLLEAVQFLQSSPHRVIHRDLKLSNILLDTNFNLKLCDFGLATQEGHPDDEHNTICGTPNYIAPEVVTLQGHSFPVDMWSLGCLLYAMLTGDLPFEQKEGVKETLQRVVDGTYAINKEYISDLAQDLLRLLLQSDPTARYNVEQALRHPFIEMYINPSQSPSFGSRNDFSHSDDKNVYPIWSTPRSEKEKEKNSFAATALVSYDGRNTDADNATTVNDCFQTHHDNDIFSRHPTQTDPLRQSFPSSSYDNTHNQHSNLSSPAMLTRKSPQNGNGHLLVNARNKVVCGNSLALSLDSSLHCGSIFSPQSSMNFTSSVPTANSSMSSTGFSPYTKSINGSTVNSVSNRSRSHEVVTESKTPQMSPCKSLNSTLESRSGSADGLQNCRRLWVPFAGRNGSNSKGHNAASNQEFCYCAPRGDVLIMSKGGDVIYLTYLLDKKKRFMPCRLSVRAGKPLTLLLGKVTKSMCQEIREIRELSLNGMPYIAETGDVDEDESTETDVDATSRSNGGGFIGKDTFPDQELDILSDSLWLSSYHVTKLPPSLKKIYATVARMLEAVKCKLPKLVLYLTDSKGYKDNDNVNKGEIASSHEQQAVCKCMIMCNEPLPDFSVRWADGMKLRYSLSDGKLHITNNNGRNDTRYQWEGLASNDADWTVSAPPSIREYLVVAQSAMRRCIAEDIRHHKDIHNFDSGGYDDYKMLKNTNVMKIKYPIVVVESIQST